MARENDCGVQFNFNGIELIAHPETDEEALSKSYSDACAKRREEWLASDECKNQQQEAERKEAEETSRRNSMLEYAPKEPSFKDLAGWNAAKEANSDHYGSGVIEFSSMWARLMEAHMSQGATLPECAEECSSLADTSGITGFMYGCAVGILSRVWKHGEELRVWHNKDVQLGTEGDKANESGGVLNPALLSIG